MWLSITGIEVKSGSVAKGFFSDYLSKLTEKQTKSEKQEVLQL